jgi:hypothetical protein
MAGPQAADGGHGLQIWGVARNILNKQSRTANRGWSSSLGVGQGGLTTHHRKTPNLLRNRKKQPRTRTDSLAKRPKSRKMV